MCRSRAGTGVLARRTPRNGWGALTQDVSVLDEGEWQQAAADLQGLVEEAGLASRLADIGERLRRWREGEDEAGGLAADALDQLAGVLGDLQIDLPRIRDGVNYLLQKLPPTLD